MTPSLKSANFLTMLTKEKIEIYRKILETEESRLKKEITDAEKPEDFGDDTDSLEEEANETDSMGTNLGIGYAHRMRLEDVEVALQKINAGNYGVCEKCNAEISKEVLDIAPESRLCENCKKKS